MAESVDAGKAEEGPRYEAIRVFPTHFQVECGIALII